MLLDLLRKIVYFLVSMTLNFFCYLNFSNVTRRGNNIFPHWESWRLEKNHSHCREKNIITWNIYWYIEIYSDWKKIYTFLHQVCFVFFVLYFCVLLVCSNVRIIFQTLAYQRRKSFQSHQSSSYSISSSSSSSSSCASPKPPSSPSPNRRVPVGLQQRVGGVRMHRWVERLTRQSITRQGITRQSITR